ncbi:cupin domain-containing protein [Burkholderia sp. Ac-20379]|uniref:cupin domain-containing protein n=1 Tax=Burkholderia sp. Ac-20379 TaxID=2703900 RepID=UPI00197E38D9|nr:cupin domain-containing protein [Burkholderia sp. Ac-20379]MBN3728498.1 anti-sigma factor [Burkholderia sp. Ac-20379]
MLVNADFTRRAVVPADQARWIASPQAGVERAMLDRVGGEQARATSLVRYARASHFPSHPHPGGEEILVLAGVFSEGERHYPAGWYLRNPPGSAHRPSSDDGALLFVKLRQMRADETRTVRIDTRDPAAWRQRGERAFCPLFDSPEETVALQRLAAQAAPEIAGEGRVELLVIEGALRLDDHSYPRGSWIRLPDGDRPACRAQTAGTTVYVKTLRERRDEVTA